MSSEASSIAGSEDWLIKLNETICDLGRAAFEDSLFDLVNAEVHVDHCAVFINNNDGKTAHLFTKSALNEETCRSLAKAYTERFYVRDPNLTPLTEAHPPPVDSLLTLLPYLPTSDYDEAYQARFFKDTGLIDKVSSLLQTRQYSIYCSFYRLKAGGRFQQDEFEAISRILPLVTNLIFAHSKLARRTEQGIQSDPIITQVPLGRSPETVANLLAAKNNIFTQLTGREREVCSRILQGYTSEAISLDLNVAISTIHTYRKRAYAKLGISSQNQLFSLCLEFIPMAG